MFAVIFLALVITIAPEVTNAQSCNPAVVSYLVRDEKGVLLNETQLRSVYQQLPKTIGDERVFIDQVSFKNDRETFYRPESAD